MRSGHRIILGVVLTLITAACGIETSSNALGIAGPTGTFDVPEIPEDFRELTNPYEGNSEQASQGGILYQANCSSCHGVSGVGDGPAAGGLEPKPKNLATDIDSKSDAYLYWRISDGGLIEPFNSVMPAWRGIMNEEQTWQVITFLRTLES